MWRSLVAHLTGGQGVAGSNPVIPTNKHRGQLHIAVGPFFLSGHFVAGLWPFCEELIQLPTAPF